MGNNTLKPVKIAAAKDQVKNILRDAIFAGELKRGDTLNINELAQQLGVSATPVREAMAILERDGLIELNPRRMAMVLGADDQYIIGYYRIRKLLEGEAAYQAATHGKDRFPELNKILEMDAKAAQAYDRKRCSEANTAFHHILGEMSDNRRLSIMISELWMSRAAFQSTYTKDDAMRNKEAHERIAKCIFDGRGEDARTEMEKHLDQGMEIVLR